MNFKLGRFVSLIISIVTGVFFFVIGSFCIVLPWSPHLQRETARLISEHTLILSLFGMGFALIGLSILITAILAMRHRSVTVRTGNLAVAVDEALIHQYLEAYWQEQFPEAHIPFQIKFKKHALQIAADLPSLPFEEQKKFLEKVKYDFSDLFGRILGYPHDVHLVATFQSEKKSLQE